jgi:hypothetical protein
MRNRIGLLSALVLSHVLLVSTMLSGCRDEEIDALTKAARNSAPSADSESDHPADTQPAADGARTGTASRLFLPGNAGFVVWYHQPQTRSARILVQTSDSQPMPVDHATLWLAGLSGPQQVLLEACQSSQPGCLQARSGLLAEAMPRGTIRFESAGQRYRVSLPTRTTSEPAADMPIKPPASLNPR